MPGSKPKAILTTSFVVCALLVAGAELIFGSMFLLSSNCNSSVPPTGPFALSNNKSPATSIDNSTTTQKASQSEEKNNKTAVDPDGVDCRLFLQDFRNGKIQEMERAPGGWEKSFVTRTITPKPFYWSTHKPELDTVRSSSYDKGLYYEKQLSLRIQEVFDAKHAQGNESIFLDVGGNIGWFSLLAAAHGASKVYTFEPNPANIVRLCESLSLNNWLGGANGDDRSKDIVVPIAKGVGSEVATKKLYRANPNNPGSYTFSKERAKKFFQNKVDESLEKEGSVGEIDIITLDSFAESHGWFESKPSIGFFKLDVEGFEPPIMQGAKKLFKSRIVELFDMEMKPKTSWEDKYAMLELVFDSGYDLYMHGFAMGPKNRVEKKYKSYKELGADIHAGMYGENLLFRRREDWKSTE